MKKQDTIKPEHFTPLLDELEQECLVAVKFIEALKIDNLSDDQKEELLGELSASITHLRMQTDYLEKEFEELEHIRL
jgi:hypothetical protein